MGLDMPGNLSENARAMSTDEFTKLFKYMQQGFAEMREEFDRIHAQFDHIYGLFDKVNKDQETIEQERLATNRQLDRHEVWIHKIAKTTHTELPK